MNILMENMFYIIQMWERHDTVSKLTELIYQVPLLLVTPGNTNLCNVRTVYFPP
jgi:hypothetical protein